MELFLYTLLTNQFLMTFIFAVTMTYTFTKDIMKEWGVGNYYANRFNLHDRWYILAPMPMPMPQHVVVYMVHECLRSIVFDYHRLVHFLGIKK